VLLLDAKAAEMGYLGAAALMPHLLFSLPVGAWVERVAVRRHLMIAADVGRMLLLASIPLAYGVGHITFAQLYGVAFASGTLAVGALSILYCTRHLGVRPGTLGLVLGAGAVGGILGAAVAPRVGRRIGLGPAFLVGQILFPLPLVLVPLAAGSRPVILAFLFT